MLVWVRSGYFERDCGAFFNKVESISFVALSDYQVSRPEFLRTECFSDGHAFVAVHGLEQLDAGEETFVSVAFVDGGFFDDVVERLAVKRPEHAVGERSDGGGPE